MPAAVVPTRVTESNGGLKRNRPAEVAGMDLASVTIELTDAA